MPRMIDGRIREVRASHIVRAVLDIVLPRECVVCGRELILQEDHICLMCLADLPKTYHWTMKRNPMADRINERIERSLSAQANDYEPYSYACALFFYHSESLYKRIPQQLKYRAGLNTGRYFAGMLGKSLASAEWFADVDMVVPVPLHWTRKWKRGYNQAEVIAGVLAVALNARLRTDVLRRVRRTRTQTLLSVEQKAGNVTGAFAVRKAALEGFEPKHILLVDDTFTTGATLYACRSALRLALPSGTRISFASLAFVTSGL